MKKMIAVMAIVVVGLLTAGCGSDSKGGTPKNASPVVETTATTTARAPTAAEASKAAIDANYKAACTGTLDAIDKLWKGLSSILEKSIDQGFEGDMSAIMTAEVRSATASTQQWLESDCARNYFPEKVKSYNEFLDKVRTNPRAALIAL